MKLIYGVKDRPRFGELLVYALQQLLAIMAATLVVPLIINGNASLWGTAHEMSPSAALVGAGLGTLVYVFFTKAKSPVFLGSSFAFIGSMTAAFAGAVSAQLGYVGLIIGAFFAGMVYVVIAALIKLSGVQWINRLMPPVVIGPTVAIIGLSLSTNAAADLKVANAGGSEYIALICGLATLAVTMICSVYGKKKLVRLAPFVIGIISGYALAAILTVIGKYTNNDALMIVDFTKITAPFVDGAGNTAVTLSSFIALPDFTFMTALDGISEISGPYIAGIALAYIPVAFVVFAEHIADHKNLSSIIEQDLTVTPGLHKTLLGDGVGSMVGAFFGGCPNTTYGESIACVALTKNASVASIIAAAIGAVLVAFISPFVAFINSIPACVMGGVCVALYGFIAVSGLKMIQGVNLDKNKNLFVVSVILVTGLGGLSISFHAGNSTIELTSIACSLILGILTNILLKKGEKYPDNKPVE